MKSQLRKVAPAVAVIVAVLAAVLLAQALSAPPASAFSQWAHDGAQGCSCHDQGTPTDASCTSCHPGFKSYPGMNCWSCHAPGQDTSTLSTPSSACSQECHLWNETQKQYIIPSTHGTNPHLGSTSACLDCHPTSVSIFDPDSSPHHLGTAPGFTQCGACHSSPQKHAGKVACATCHANATAFHTYQADSPGFKTAAPATPRSTPARRSRPASAPAATRAPAVVRLGASRRSPRSSSAAAATARSCMPAR